MENYSAKAAMQTSQLMELFEDQLKDIFWAEKVITKEIPLMIEKTTSIELIEALSSHLADTNEHVTRLAQVFGKINKKPVAKKCEAMTGLIKEAEEVMASCEPGAMRDAGIISVAQKVEHYEIASYSTLLQFAETLELTEAAHLLQATLSEEEAADKKLTEITANAITIETSKEET